MSLIRPKREPPKPIENPITASIPEDDVAPNTSTLGTPVTPNATEVSADPPDTDMEGLLESMQSSLLFVPPNLRRKQAGKAKS